MPRSVNEIATEIRELWRFPHHGAIPYLDAMQWLTAISDSYGADDGESIVRRFLTNATGWRGEDARRVKKELCELLDSARAQASRRLP